jgi:hypothetical protein
MILLKYSRQIGHIDVSFGANVTHDLIKIFSPNPGGREPGTFGERHFQHLWQLFPFAAGGCLHGQVRFFVAT